MELLLADAARPFAVALAVTGGLGVLEVLLLLGGLGAILAIPMTLLIRALFIDSQPQHRWVRALFSSGPPPGTARRKKKPVPAIAQARLLRPGRPLA